MLNLSQVTWCSNFKFIVKEANTAALVIANLAVKSGKSSKRVYVVSISLTSALLADVPTRC